MNRSGVLAGAALPALLLGCAVAAQPETRADPATMAAGKRAFQKCYACHSLEPARNDLTGPTLWRVLGRPIASERSFAYSPALRRFAERHPAWTEDLLHRFIEDPEALVPGTSMTFHGIPDRTERTALIAYLAGTGFARSFPSGGTVRPGP